MIPGISRHDRCSARGDVEKNTGAITLASNGQSVIGRIKTVPAVKPGSKVTNSASFLRTIILVR
jgi:hypothetical protein